MLYEVNVTFDGIISVNANSPEEAMEYVKNLPLSILVEKASGTWEAEIC